LPRVAVLFCRVLFKANLMARPATPTSCTCYIHKLRVILDFLLFECSQSSFIFHKPNGLRGGGGLGGAALGGRK